MSIKNWFKTGDRVRIGLGGKYCATIIEGLEGDDGVLISPPITRYGTIMPEPGQICLLVTTCKTGIISFRICVEGIVYGDNIPLIRAQAISGPEKIQRRKSYRAEIMLDVTVTREIQPGEIEEECLPFDTKTVNVSENGLLFVSDGSYRIGDRVLCDLTLDKFDMDEKLERMKAVVTRLEEPLNGPHRAAVAFTDYPGKTGDTLLKFIFVCQRKNNDRR